MKQKASYLIIAVFFLAFTQNYAAETKPTADIRHPGPDDANFTVSAFTLPKGRCYIETFPLWTEMLDCPGNRIYRTPYLVRIGLTDFMELRFFGNGLTHKHDKYSSSRTGFGSFNTGFKFHLWGKPDTHWIPSTGFEVYIATPLASKDLKEGTQFACTSLFDLRCTDGLLLEWNIGIYTYSLRPIKRNRQIGLLVEWSLQQEISHSMSLFFEGAYENALFFKNVEALVLGAGFISYITDTIAIFGSYNWSVLHRIKGELVNFGFALAF